MNVVRCPYTSLIGESTSDTTTAIHLIAVVFHSLENEPNELGNKKSGQDIEK